MGHSQSYDLWNPEIEDKTKDPVRGVRRVSKEHQTDTSYSTENTENSDSREDELRERIRNEQLMKREAELESMRIRQHESREPIIDAYRTTSQPSPSQTEIYREFNYYDSLKHPNPVDPSTYFQLRPRKEVNNGTLMPIGTPSTDYSIPRDPKETPRYVPPMSGTYSKRTVTTTFSYTAAKEPTVIPQYDTVPSDPVTWRAPHYDEVPVVREIPVEYSNPEKTYRTPEVSRTPLEATVTQRDSVPYSTPVTYRTQTPVKPSTPEPLPVPLEPIHRSPEVSRIPLGSTVTQRDPVPYKAYSTPVTYRTPVKKIVTPVQSPDVVILERFYRTPEVSRIPLGSTVTPRDPVPYKAYSTPVTYRTVKPSTPEPLPAPLEPIHRSLELSRIPLVSTVTPRDSVPYKAYSTPVTYRTSEPLPGSTVTPHSPVPYSTPVTYRTPTPTTPARAPSRVPTPLDQTQLTPEVGQMPLATTVAHRSPVPYPLTHTVAPDHRTTPEYRNLRRSPTPPTPELFTRHPEVPGTPMEHHVTYSNYGTYSTYRSATPASEHLSEIHAEKRMIVGIESEPEKEEKENVSYVTVAEFPTYSTATSPSPKIDNWPEQTLEQLHKHPEVLNRPVYVRPSQSSYQSYQSYQPPPKKILIQPQPTDKVIPPVRYQHQETQYSRRPSEDGILEMSQKPKTCQVENCTHVEVRDSPVAMRRRKSEDRKEKENHLQIYIDEKEMEGVIDLAKDEDVGTPTSTSRRCFEEKLHYNSYFPTLSLGRRPVVSFYDKLH